MKNVTVTDNVSGASFTGTPSDAAAWVRKLVLYDETGGILTRFADALERGVASDADATYLGLKVSL